MAFTPKLEVKNPNLFSDRVAEFEKGLTEFLDRRLAKENSIQEEAQSSVRKAAKFALKKIFDFVSPEVFHVPFEDAYKYVKETTHVTAVMTLEMRPILESMARIKRLAKDVASTPKDLSRFYRSVREKLTHKYEGKQTESPLFFGELVKEVVDQIYKVQDPTKTSLMSQLIYVFALSGTMFEELGNSDPLWIDISSTVTDELKRRNGMSRHQHVLRMLKRDFVILASNMILQRYFIDGATYSGMDRNHILKHTWGLKNTKIWPQTVNGNLVPSAYYDIPMLGSITRKFGDDYDTKKGDASEISFAVQTLLGRLFLQFFVTGIITESKTGENWKENIRAMNSEIEDVNWSEIRFGREVPPGALKMYFPSNKDPLFVTVDPSPSKAYLAVVSVTTKTGFDYTQKHSGTHNESLDNLSPLRKPFSAAKVDTESYCFLVNKTDGELYSYGDSNSLVRMKLGDNYESVKKLVHDALRNLTHATYVPKIKPIAGETIDMQPEAPNLPVIPNKPVERATQNEGDFPEVENMSMAYRRAHSRILPKGWFLSSTAYENAKKSGQLDLWVLREGINTEGVKTLTYLEKLDLTKTHKELVKDKDRLLKQYGENIRFQTYVSEAGESFAEDN